MSKETPQILIDGRRSMLLGLFVVNEKLPAGFHDKRSGGRSLAGLCKVLAKMNAKEKRQSAAKQEKAARLERSTRYAASQANTGEIQYDQDNNRLYRKQLAFVSAMLNGGQITQDELKE